MLWFVSVLMVCASVVLAIRTVMLYLLMRLVRLCVSWTFWLKYKHRLGVWFVFVEVGCVWGCVWSVEGTFTLGVEGVYRVCRVCPRTLTPGASPIPPPPPGQVVRRSQGRHKPCRQVRRRTGKTKEEKDREQAVEDVANILP